MTTTWIKSPLAIYAPECEAGGGLVIQGSKIVEAVAVGHSPQRPYDSIFDASAHVILPGLINTHHHFYQTLTRACSDAINKPLFPWLQALYPIWARLTPEHIYLSSQLAMAELMLSGCTTVADHHYLFPRGLEDAIDLQIQAANDLGVRAALSRGSMTLGEKDGGLPPQSVIQDEDTIMKDCERLINRYHQAGEGAKIQIVLAPCSPFSVTRSIMQATAELAEKHNVLMHTHLCETHDETQFCLEKFGMRPVDYLEDTGWMNDRSWLAHGIHFNDDEMIRLSRAGVGVCHCASSNMILASGTCPVHTLETAGVAVGLGVDGSASNDGSNLMQDVRMAFLLQRLNYGAENITHQDALRWVTRGSARCLNREDIGVIGPGKQADLALFKLDELRFSGAQDPLAALVLCGAYRADYVMVGGHWRVENGMINNFDIFKLMHSHHRAAQTLWN